MKPGQFQKGRLSLNRQSIVKLSDMQKGHIAGGANATPILGGASGCVCATGASCGFYCQPVTLLAD
jgi:hypothetical protein